MSVRVLLCDDQALVRSGFRMILEAREDIEVVAEAEDGAQALELTRRHLPDVVLMDVRMPRIDGVEATRRLVGAGAAARILILTTFDLDEYVFEALRAGASGFLLKDVQPAQLVDAVRVIARGDALLDPVVTRRLLDRFAHFVQGDRFGKIEMGIRGQRRRENLDPLAARENRDQLTRAEKLTTPRARRQPDRLDRSHALPAARAIRADCRW